LTEERGRIREGRTIGLEGFNSETDPLDLLPACQRGGMVEKEES